MLEIIKHWFRFFIFSNLFVAFCALALLLSSEIILESKNDQLSVFVFFSTLFTYNFQRIVRARDLLNQNRKSWLAKNKKTIIYMMVISAAISLYYYFSFNIRTKIAIIICGIISTLYPFGLRQVPFLKIFIISISWAICTFLLLVFANNIDFDFNVWSHFLTRFLFVFAITIPFDIRDIKFDNPRLKTIPMVFGNINARFIGILFLIVSQSVYIWLYFYNLFPFNYLVATAVIFFATALIVLRATTEKSEIYFSFGVESSSIIFYAILLASSCIL